MTTFTQSKIYHKYETLHPDFRQEDTYAGKLDIKLFLIATIPQMIKIPLEIQTNQWFVYVKK